MAKIYGLTELFDDDLVVSNGSIGINVNPDTSLYGVKPHFHVGSDSGATFFVLQYAGSSTYAGLIIQKSRGSLGSESATQNGDILGSILYQSYGTSTTVSSASIEGQSTQTHTNSAGGGRLLFRTTPNNSTGLSTRMTIDQDGEIGIGTSTPSADLHVVGDGIYSSQLTVGESIIDSTTVLKVRGSGAISRVFEAVTSSGQNALWVNDDSTLFMSNGVGMGTSLVTPNTYGFQIQGSQFSRGFYTNISHTAADAYGAYFSISSFNSNDNYSLYLNSVNNGSGDAYALDVGAGNVRLGDLISGATAGYVLQTTTSDGILDWVDPNTLVSGGGTGSGIYAGSGTLISGTTDVTMGSSHLAFDNGLFYINAERDRVGVGLAPSSVTNATWKLHVQGASQTLPTISNESIAVYSHNKDFNISLITPANQTGSIYFGDPNDEDVGGIRYSHTLNAMSFNVNAIEVARFVNKRMAIGITVPDAPLHISDGGTEPSWNSNEQLIVQNNNGIFDDSRVAIIAGNEGNSIIDFGDVDSYQAGEIDYNHNTNHMTFTTNGGQANMILNDNQTMETKGRALDTTYINSVVTGSINLGSSNHVVFFRANGGRTVITSTLNFPSSGISDGQELIIRTLDSSNATIRIQASVGGIRRLGFASATTLAITLSTERDYSYVYNTTLGYWIQTNG